MAGGPSCIVVPSYTLAILFRLLVIIIISAAATDACGSGDKVTQF